MKNLFLVLAFTQLASGQSGTVIPLDTWINPTPIGGYPSTPAGYAKSVYVPSLKIICSQTNYLTRGVTSEIQDAYICYDVAANYYSIVEQGGGPHSLHSFNGGHEVSVADYYAACDCIIFQTDDSYGNQAEILSDTWIWYASALTMRDGPIPSLATGGAVTRTWLASGQLNMGAIDQTTGKFVILDDYRQSGSGAGFASVCTLNALGVMTTCTPASSTGIPSTLINSGNVRWNSTDSLFYWWGGGTIGSPSSALAAVTTYNDVTDTWAQVTTTCTGPDCSGTAPPGRQCAGFAYSSKDNKFVMMGGRDLTAGCSTNTATVFNDAWIYDPVARTWTEICGPSATVCAYIPTNDAYNDSLEYDANSNLFVFQSYNTTWLLAISTPLGYGRTTPSYNPPAGSLNRTTPTGTATQGNVFDVNAYVDSGTTLYVTASQTGSPTDSVTGCEIPTGFTGSVSGSGVITYYPAGAADAGCQAIRYGEAQGQPHSHPFGASIGGTKYLLYESHNTVNGAGEGEVGTHSFLRSYNASGWATGVDWLGGWSPQYCNSSMACSVGAATGFNLAGGTTYTVTLTPMPAGLATGQQVIISQGTGSGELSRITVLGSNVSFTPNGAHSGQWTIAPSGFVPCLTLDCSATLTSATNPKINTYPTGMTGVSGNPVAGFIEENQNQSPRPHYLYVAEYVSGAWVQLGTGALDANTTIDSHVTYASPPATDGSGNVAICWNEEVESSKTVLTTQPALYCSYWNGTSWTSSSSLNITTTDWTYLPSTIYAGGSWYVAFTESSQGGNLRLYALKCNTSWSCSRIGTGPLNINASTWIAYHPTLATDGTNVYMAWEEQATTGSFALGYVKKWNGTSWSQIGSAISAGPSDSVHDMSMAYVNYTPAVAFADLEYGNLAQVYARYWNGSTWAASSAPGPSIPAIF